MTMETAAVWGDVARTNAERFGARIAFVGPDGVSVSFAAFNGRVNRLCHALARLGLQPGERVALLSRNRIDYVAAFGVSKSGLVVVPLNWRLTAPELAYQFAHSAPAVVIADAAHRPVVDGLRGDLDGVRHFISLDGLPESDTAEGWLDYAAVLDAAPDHEPEPVARPGDVLVLMYTSGTTGRPKGVELTHRGLLNNARSFIAALGLGPGPASGEVTLSVMPLFHVGGMWYHLFPSFAAGATTIIHAEFDPVRVLATLTGAGVTNIHLVPTMIAALLDTPGAERADLSALRLVFYAASAIPSDLLRRAMAVLGRDIFLQSYGSTECGGVAVLAPADHRRALAPGREELLTACGKPFPGVEVAILDLDGQPAPTGVIGEVAVRSAQTMRGYTQAPEATAAAMAGGWVRSGDLGRFDDEGYLYIVDRKNDMIVTGGENVYPREVEEALYADPDIVEAAVFALPDPKWVERVAAAVRLRDGVALSEQDVIARVRGRLAGYKCPKTIFFVDTLPKSGAGKILKKELRRAFAVPASGD